jgi:hypothetical protein
MAATNSFEKEDCMLRFLTHCWVRPYRQKRPPSKKVAIVIPLSNRTDFTLEERISLHHLVHYLGRYDKFLIAPLGMRIEMDGFQVKYFARKFFGSAAAHTHLTYAPFFYKAFEDYQYIFIYHLDSLAFADELENWCDKGLDYIGPPWIQCADSPWVTKPRVGNGGFTLMKVETTVKVLYLRYRQEPGRYWKDMFNRNGRRLDLVIRTLRWLQRWFPSAKLVNAPLKDWDEMQNPSLHGRNNDAFWSDEAVKYLPDFRVASLEDGLRFAFEVAPRKCYEMNGGRLPFGCHAWARYDRKFWEPFLLSLHHAGKKV